MRKAALLTAGALALPLAFSLPAAAQQQNSPPPKAQQQQPAQQSQGAEAQQGQQAQNADQNQLSSDQIKQVQQALDQKGFKAGRPDGKLGPETKQALSKFQQSQKLQQTGQPDDQTLQALGIDVNGGTSGASTTGAAPSDQNQNQPSDQNPNQPPANANRNGQK
ncbi:MAG TPA: peptidoglycan-binding domain-containing protein [Xanthobacteraceae bacterium]|nr:peptidoglycan-binding domain-containing protein [Xanthobacteraceae bacterium]